MRAEKIDRILRDTAYVREGGSDAELRCAQYLVDCCADMGLNARIEAFPVDMARIDDAELYFMFVRLAIHHRKMNDPSGRDQYLEELLANYREPEPGAKARVAQVLRVMLTAWAAAQLRRTAENMVKELKET